MTTMVVAYKQAEDTEAFERRYVDGHLPLVKAYDNIKDAKFFRVSRRIVGDFPYSNIFVGTWADKDGMKADLNSEKAAEATEDAKSFAPAFDVFFIEEVS